MPNASGTEMSASDDRNDTHLSILSDLALLIERIQESKTLIEAASCSAWRSGNRHQRDRIGRCHAWLSEGASGIEHLRSQSWRCPPLSAGGQNAERANLLDRSPEARLETSAAARIRQGLSATAR